MKKSIGVYLLAATFLFGAVPATYATEHQTAPGEMGQEMKQEKKTEKRKRCPKGTHYNKKAGKCVAKADKAAPSAAPATPATPAAPAAPAY